MDKIQPETIYFHAFPTVINAVITMILNIPTRDKSKCQHNPSVVLRGGIREAFKHFHWRHMSADISKARFKFEHLKLTHTPWSLLCLSSQIKRASKCLKADLWGYSGSQASPGPAAVPGPVTRALSAFCGMSHAHS